MFDSVGNNELDIFFNKFEISHPHQNKKGKKDYNASKREWEKRPANDLKTRFYFFDWSQKTKCVNFKLKIDAKANVEIYNRAVAVITKCLDDAFYYYLILFFPLAFPFLFSLLPLARSLLLMIIIILLFHLFFSDIFFRVRIWVISFRIKFRNKMCSKAAAANGWSVKYEKKEPTSLNNSFSSTIHAIRCILIHISL